MKKNILVLGAVILFICGLVFQPDVSRASYTNPQIDSSNSVAVSTASVQILPARKLRRYLLIENVCAENIGISEGGTTAAIGTAGTVTLFPGGSLRFLAPDVPQNAFNAISALGSCGITIWELN